MKKRWQKLSAKEQVQAIVVAIFFIIGLYGMVFYVPTNKKRTRAENMLNRKKNRVETRLTATNSRLSVNPKKTSRLLKETEAEISRLEAELADSELGLAPLDNANGVQQQILLEISTLAKQTQTHVLSMSGKGIARKGQVRNIIMDKELGRPIIILQAQGSYWHLVDFLNGLGDLSYYVSVMRIVIQSKDFSEAGLDKKPGQTGASIDVLMEIAI